MASPTRQLIEERLTGGRSLASLVMTERRKGNGWRKIADTVSNKSGVVISHSTLRNWFGTEDRKLGRPRMGVVRDKQVSA